MVLFIDKYYSSAAKYIATGIRKKKLDLDLVIGLNVFIFQIHDRDIQHSKIINRGFERKPKAYRVHLLIWSLENHI